MDHAPNSTTFFHNYLNRNICADLWAIHRAENPQQALLQQATSHGGSRDSRRKFTLTKAQTDEIKENSRYVSMTEHLENSPHVKGAARKRLIQDRKNWYEKIKRRKEQEVAKAWTRQQAYQDVERQLQGEDICQTGNQDAQDMFPPMSPVQQRMFDALTAPLINDLDAQFERRAKAIQALVDYCGEEEGLRNNIADATIPEPPPELQKPASPQDQMQKLARSVMVSTRRLVRRCYVCVAKACLQGPDDPKFNQLCRQYASPAGLARHFSSVHLDYLADDSQYDCPICHIQLRHKNQVRRHSQAVHGINTNRTRPMQYKGD